MSEPNDYSQFVSLPAVERTAANALSRDDLRRFSHATMDDLDWSWDAESARAAGFPDVVAPPLFPVHAVRRAPGTADPLVRGIEDANWDGSELDSLWHGLPVIESQFVRHLNGGSEVEFHSLLSVGETVVESSRYSAVEEKEGRQGSMLLTTVETAYSTTDGRPLATVRMTVIRR